MQLPDNYQVCKDAGGDRWLYENVWVLRPVTKHDVPTEAKCRRGPLAGQYVRPVARFPQTAKLRDIEDVALYDHLSRSPDNPSDRRRSAYKWLARRFEECRR